MSSIRILSDRVANQIAAGEVIERPVAVVKELIENSIDAGATRIEVEFRNGGKSYIRIEDNGKGMSPDEALLSLERHATSKIREAADLNEISSFGFRGEALPSIASVSKFTLRTRTSECSHGTEILINGGKLLDKRECGMPTGTTIEVSHLFNSVPARRKFLKTDPTETAHITYATRLFAVAHPKVAFRLLENGRTLFQSPACDQLQDRIAEIWGRQLANDLIKVDVKDPKTGYRLSGLTAKPGVGRSTRRELVTLVNRRPVDSRTLGFAVLDAYHSRIQKGRYPPAFLFLDIDSSEVDVNVHPAKREVRFRDDGAVRRFVLDAITQTLEAQQTSQHTAPAKATPPPLHQPKAPSVQQAPAVAIPAANTTKAPKPRTTQRPAPSATTPPLAASPKPTVDTSPATIPTAEPPKQQRTAWKLVANFKQQYALFETPKGLVMLHLRRADQRIRFERIQSGYGQQNVPQQQLLIPVPVELEPLASELLSTHMDLINSNGFQIEPFGRHFFRIEATPEWLKPEQAESFIRDMIDMIRQRGGSQRNNHAIWESISHMAVKDSYRASDTISNAAVSKLAEDLMRCKTPHTCPAGKPTYTEVSWNEWAKRLGDT